MRIAIEGCCHGQLDDIYGTIRLLEQREGYKIDLVLICGDFQSIRNEADMECMSVPMKYRELGTFWKYYSGQVKAPYPTIFIGGNHEASNYLWELYHGGWVCENIYYLGHANVIQFGGLRIGGLSGIAKGQYERGHFETSPYNPSHLRSAYYVREFDVKKLLSVSEPVDIFLSHDWPRGVERFGDLNSLMRKKNYFIQEIMRNSLGSHPNELILAKMQPTYWFSAHLHIRYAALVNHDMYGRGTYPVEAQAAMDRYKNPVPQVANPDAIDINLDDNLEDEETTTQETTTQETTTQETTTQETTTQEATAQETTAQETVAAEQPTTNTRFTKFLSLDKCLPRRDFLQVLDIPTANDETSNYDFYYDLEWLAITRATQPYLSTTYEQTPMPSESELKEAIQKEKLFLEDRIQRGLTDLKIPHNFEPTAPAHVPGLRLDRPTLTSYQYPFLNPQTVQFCKEIDIENKVNPHGRQPMPPPSFELNQDVEEQSNKRPKIEAIESEIVIDDDEFL